MSFTKPYHLYWHAARVAYSGAGIALISSFIALGALFSDNGWSLFETILFSLVGYALPGQLVVAEMVSDNANIVAITIAVFLVNARLLPMTVVTFSILLASDGKHKTTLADYARAHLIAVTSWVCFLGARPNVPPALQTRFFTCMAFLLWVSAALATALGFYIGERLPEAWLVGLLFLNPIYFLCMMLNSLANRRDATAFFLGMALLPFVHALSSTWDIIIAGVVAGCVAFAMHNKSDKDKSNNRDKMQ